MTKSIIQPQVNDTVNIQMHAQGLTANNYQIFKKNMPMTCIQNYDDYSIWKFQNTGTYTIAIIDEKPFNIELEAVGDVLFNKKNKTFNIIGTRKPGNITVDLIESNEQKIKQAINLIESFSLTYTSSNQHGSFWSGNGISTNNQSNTNTQKLVQSQNQTPIVTGHAYSTIHIAKSKFDSYFGVPPVLPLGPLGPVSPLV